MNDTNKYGASVPNGACAICAEARQDVGYPEHARHVDFIATRGHTHGWHTPSPSNEQLAAEFAGAAELRKP